MERNSAKEKCRKEMLRNRAALTPQEISARSERIAQRLFQTQAWTQAREVLGYYAVRGEVDPAGILEQAWAQGKEVFLPRTDGRDMIFLRYTPDTVLEKGACGIPEPPEKAFPWNGNGRNRRADRGLPDCLVLVPGTAFSPEGYRIGYGGGYYDRFFGSLREQVVLAGLAYDFQMTEALVYEPHDVRMHMVVTESTVRLSEGYR